MQQYILKRLLVAIPVLIAVTIAVSALVRIIPGDAVALRVAESGYVSQDAIPAIKHELGLDRSFPAQYLSWVGGVVHGDFGDSFVTQSSTGERLAKAIPITLELAIIAMLVGLAVAIPIGIFSAVRQNSVGDYAGRIFSIAGLSVPDFIIATLLIIYLAIYFKWTPPITYVSFFDSPTNNLKLMALPAVVLGWRFSSVVMRMVRSSMLEVLREDYIRTAWAKGLKERVVIARHAVKNAFIPVITITGGQFGYLLGGAAIVEIIFNIPGVGYLTIQAIRQRDYPQLQANVMFLAVVTLLLNLLVDLSYGWFDPRVRYSATRA